LPYGNAMAQEADTLKVERRLAAILAADVFGYSRLMGADEEGTLAQLKAHRRQLVDPKIRQHHGRIVNTTGDGMLAEFASPVEAVRCAVEIQRGMVTRNAEIAADKRIIFRAGINLGDVIAEKGDLFGDGVNVAARLENLAEPGGITITRMVRDAIRDKLPFDFADTGEHQVKNIARPVRVYALSSGAVEGLPEALPAGTAGRRRIASIPVIAGAAVASLVLIAGGLWWSRSSDFASSRTSAVLEVPPSAALARLAEQSAPRMSIVVLPFTNLSGDPAQEYFADGFTESLTSEISHLRGSFVIARASAFTYKGKVEGEKQIAHELGVRYVVEGGIQKLGNHIRVNAELIDGETGSHLWAERYDRDSAADLLQIQEEITRQIANALGHTLEKVESERSWRDHPKDPDSVDLTLRADAMSWATPKLLADARRLYERALELDGQNVDALLGLGWTYFTEFDEGWVHGDAASEALKRADDAVTRALSIDRRSAPAYYLKSRILAYMTENDYRGEIVQAIAAAETAVEINPNSPNTLAWLGRLYAKAGHPERTAALIEQAIRLNPARSISYGHTMGMAQLQMGHIEEAINSFQKAVLASPEYILSWAGLTGAFIAAGRDVEAQTALVKLREVAARDGGYKLDYPPDRDVLYLRVQLALLRLGRWPYSLSLWKLVLDPTSGNLSRALLKFQADEKLPQTGQLDEATLARLGITSREGASASK
jgi:class 3 adenylate cyclase/TolB-like protein/cytochrome c-type biogenesis protein CcmH/NrfG